MSGASTTGGAQTAGGVQNQGGSTAAGGQPARGGSIAGGAGGSNGGTPTTGGTPAVGGASGGAVGGSALGGSTTGGTASGGTAATCPSSACTSPTEQNRVCNDADIIPLGKYRVLNNLWGDAGTVSTDGQCSYSLCNTSSAIAWGTDYTWTSGDAISVKSYAAVILGWHWSTIDAASGLPVQLSAGRDVTCTWSFRVSSDANASQNVAYDLWLYTASNVGTRTQPTDEIMVWLYRVNKDDPIGTFQTTVTLEGIEWDLYRGTNGTTNVFSFLSRANLTCATLNLAHFLDDLVTRTWVQNTKYLISVEAGTELVRGTGSVDTDYYSCSVP
jgi:xyloglucan-specific endo-beta-1,4-glucanase